jgi:hypothetical protein
MTATNKPANLPLIYRMAGRAAPLPKRGIEELHKSVVNQLRKRPANPS